MSWIRPQTVGPWQLAEPDLRDGCTGPFAVALPPESRCPEHQESQACREPTPRESRPNLGLHGSQYASGTKGGLVCRSASRG